MNAQELNEIVNQQMDSPFVLGRIACNLRCNEGVEQRHHDKKDFEVFWRRTEAFWRCTIFLNKDTELCLAQIDLHDDTTVRVESYEPCSITISPEDGILSLTRYRPRKV
ncbi:MAG: hypothetical protein WBM14_03255 [Terracidiphilus sp.]|jgi:hypothetical protein